MLWSIYMDWQKWIEKLTLVSYWILWINTGIFFALGLLGALLGGAWTSVGEGLGGGWSIPSMVFNIPILLAIPGLIIGFQGIVRKGFRKRVGVIFFIASLGIGAAFILIAHSIDPCDRRFWTLSDRWGSQPLCERFGAGISIHTRFHLLLHSAPVFIVMLIYHPWFKRLYRNLKETDALGSPATHG